MSELEGIRRHAGYYARLIAPATHEPDPAVAERIARLHRLKNTTAYPFLLTVIDAIAARKLLPRALPETLDLIETFIVRRLVCNVPTNQLRVIFRGLCGTADDSSDTDDFMTQVRSALSQNQRCPTAAAFRDALTRRPIYGGSKRDAARYLLERLERSFAHKERADPSAAGVQVEHVMPQTLTTAWRDMLAPGGYKNAADVLHADWLHTLGNLTLSAYNAELSNSPFPAKRRRYADSNFSLNEYFGPVDHWDAPAIEARGHALAEIALVLWQNFALPGAAASPAHASGGRAKSERTVAVEIDGERFEVSSMLQAVHRVFQHLSGRYPQRFADVIHDVMPAHRRGHSPDGLRTPRPVGHGFIGFHGSNNALRRRAGRLMRALGVAESRLEFVTEPNN